MLCRSPPPSRVSERLNLASLHALSPCLGRGGYVAGCVPLPAAPSRLASDKNSTWGGSRQPLRVEQQHRAGGLRVHPCHELSWALCSGCGDAGLGKRGQDAGLYGGQGDATPQVSGCPSPPRGLDPRGLVVPPAPFGQVSM